MSSLKPLPTDLYSFYFFSGVFVDYNLSLLYRFETFSQRDMSAKVEETPKDNVTLTEDNAEIPDEKTRLLEDNKIDYIKKEADEVTEAMRENVDKLLEREDGLASLDNRVEALNDSASGFQKTTNAVCRKMWWQNTKLWFIVGAAAAIIITIVLIWFVRK